VRDNEFESKLLDLVFNILGLALDRHFGHPWQVDQSEVNQPRRIDSQADGLHGNVFIHSSNFVGLGHDLLLDLIKVEYFFSLSVQEFAELNYVIFILKG